MVFVKYLFEKVKSTKGKEIKRVFSKLKINWSYFFLSFYRQNLNLIEIDRRETTRNALRNKYFEIVEFKRQILFNYDVEQKQGNKK